MEQPHNPEYGGAAPILIYPFAACRAHLCNYDTTKIEVYFHSSKLQANYTDVWKQIIPMYENKKETHHHDESLFCAPGWA
ncbi:MAG: hypothetical protein K2F70_04885 [Muribaculaceae bacterium]|nr:hypothetical protein [Muribaculaceae bacterium]